MAVHILYSTVDDVVKKTCFTKKQILAYLWRIDVRKDTLITVADVVTMQAVSGTRRTLVDVIGSMENINDLFEYDG